MKSDLNLVAKSQGCSKAAEARQPPLLEARPHRWKILELLASSWLTQTSLLEAEVALQSMEQALSTASQ